LSSVSDDGDAASLEIVRNANNEGRVFGLKASVSNPDGGGVGGIDLSGIAEEAPAIKLSGLADDLTDVDPTSDAPLGWMPVYADGTTYAVPLYEIID
jgi:hypothetical protein